MTFLIDINDNRGYHRFPASLALHVNAYHCISLVVTRFLSNFSRDISSRRRICIRLIDVDLLIEEQSNYLTGPDKIIVLFSRYGVIRHDVA